MAKPKLRIWFFLLLWSSSFFFLARKMCVKNLVGLGRGGCCCLEPRLSAHPSENG